MILRKIIDKESSDYDIRRKVFIIALQLSMVATLLFSILYCFTDSDNVVARVILALSFVFCCSLNVIYYKTGRHEILSIIFTIAMLGIILPSFIVYGLTVRGATPLWFAASAITIFFMMDIKKFWWIFGGIVYWDTFIFIKTFMWNKPEYPPEDPLRFILTVIISFALICFALIGIIALQEKNINLEKQAIDESREVVLNAGAAKSRFLANMSHEIRTPMNSIIGLSELMLKDDLDSRTKEAVTTVKDSAYDLLDIIDNVLMYSKLDSKKMGLIRINFNTYDFLRSFIDSVSLSIEDKNLEFWVNIDGNIPKVLNGDDINIRQALMRLMFVALQLTDNGRIMFMISHEKIPNTNQVRIFGGIMDTGYGLNPYDLDAIFGAYDTYDSRQNSNLKGLGLKLSICKALLNMMGGDLTIKSIEGMGLQSNFSFVCNVVDPDSMISVENEKEKTVLIHVTNNRELDIWKYVLHSFSIKTEYTNSRFIFEKAIQDKKYDYILVNQESYDDIKDVIAQYHIEDMVYVAGSAQKAYGDFDKCRIIHKPVTCIVLDEVFNDRWKEASYTNKLASIEYDGSAAKILVVDDNNVNLKVAMGIFKHYKINIDIAKSGEECIRKLQNVKYDIVFLDMVMPELSGPDTLKQIRAMDDPYMKNVPIIALTANTGANIRNEVKDMGFQEYLAKPIKQKYLLDLLLGFLSKDVLKIVEKADISDKKENDLAFAENILDTEKGIATIGFNKDSYCAILNTYYSEGMRKKKDIPTFLANGDISRFTTEVHGIKSSSASIGAMTVSEMFKELEFAGKDNNLELINKKFPVYMEAYDKILQDVHDYLVENNCFEYTEETPKDLSLTVKEELTREMIEELKSNIDKMNLKECDRIVEDYSLRNFGEEHNRKIAEIKSAYEMFDFHGVKQVLSELLV